MTDPDVAIKTGMVLGLLYEAWMDGLLLSPRYRRDEHGDFTNVIELVNDDGVVEFTVTVEKTR